MNYHKLKSLGHRSLSASQALSAGLQQTDWLSCLVSHNSEIKMSPETGASPDVQEPFYKAVTGEPFYKAVNEVPLIEIKVKQI